MSEKRTGLGRGLDALLPGRQVSRAVAPILSPKEPATRVGHTHDLNDPTLRSADTSLRVGHPIEVPPAQGAYSTPSGHSGQAMVGQPTSENAVADRDALAGAREIPLELIERNPYQTRGKIDESALEELAASIREQGVLQPILVREIRIGASPSRSGTAQDSGGGASRQAFGNSAANADEKGSLAALRMNNPPANSAHSTPSGRSGQAMVGHPQTGGVRYQLMAGERRWLASMRAGKKTIPAVVRQASDEQAMEITIIENLQREDLNAMEQARAFEKLAREFRLTQEQIAVKTGKDRASVANFLRLLKLPPGVQALIESDALSLGHGKVLMMLTNESAEMVERVAQKASASGMSVRDLEEMITKLMGPPRDVVKQAAQQRDPNVRAAEEDIQRTLGCRVTIKDRDGKGKIVLEYASLEDFDRIVDVLGKR